MSYKSINIVLEEAITARHEPGTKDRLAKAAMQHSKKSKSRVYPSDKIREYVEAGLKKDGV